MQTPVALSDGQIVLLIVVAEVVEVKVERLWNAVGCAAEGVLLCDDVHFSQDGHFHVSHKHIVSEEGRTTGGACGSKVEGHRSGIR